MLFRLLVLMLLLASVAQVSLTTPLRGQPGDALKAAKTTVVLVRTVEWNPDKQHYVELKGVSLIVRRGEGDRKITLRNLAKENALETQTDDKGLAKLEFLSGMPVTLVSVRMADKHVPEVLSLASDGLETHRITIALVRESQYEAYARQNPAVTPAHVKYRQAFEQLINVDEKLAKAAAAGYRATKPKTSVIVPSSSLKDKTSWDTLLKSATKHKSVPIIVLLESGNWKRAADLQKAGVLTLGIVDAEQGKSGPKALKAVEQWYKDVPRLNGIYIRNQPPYEMDDKWNETLRQSVNEQAHKAKAPPPLVLGNPGRVSPALLDKSINYAITCLNKTKFDPKEGIHLPERFDEILPRRSAFLIAQVKDAEIRETILRGLLDREVGYLFLSDNDFKNFPSLGVWSDMLSSVAKANSLEVWQRLSDPTGLVARFELPRGTKVFIPGNQVEDVVADITFPGEEKAIRLVSGLTTPRLTFVLTDPSSKDRKKDRTGTQLVMKSAADLKVRILFGAEGGKAMDYQVNENESNTGNSIDFSHNSEQPALIRLRPAPEEK